eukprot:TRINITY_DN28545_c0_g1_i1.p1 TRINITY_DN28545_c0_g1~~TRINITY_DN28545_c0_g1_i1.p1  ORF type:complete len:906 (+),score=352.94 TRINITY_DN28545_c0_g1_i1:90-2720(+)
MSYLMRGLLGQEEGGAGRAPGRPAADVGVLLGRIRSATVLQDRRDAVRELAELGEGLDVMEAGGVRDLLECLARNRDDAEIRTDVLSILVDLSELRDHSGRFLAAFVAEAPATQAVVNLLDVLKQGAFHPRLNVLKFLTAVLDHNASALLRQLLQHPDGIHALVEVLSDGSNDGILRNEGLLLMKSMVAADQEIQKIVAFQGVFGALFSIIDEVGGVSEGGIVVDDCIDVLQSLLGDNASNRVYFRETEGLGRLRPLIHPGRPEPPRAPPLGDSATAAVARALGLVTALLRGPPAEAEAARMAAAGLARRRIRLGDGSHRTEITAARGPTLLDAVYAAALHSGVGPHAQAAALRALRCMVQQPAPECVLQAVFDYHTPAREGAPGLRAVDCFAERLAAPGADAELAAAAGGLLQELAAASPEVCDALAASAAGAAPLSPAGAAPLQAGRLLLRTAVGRPAAGPLPPTAAGVHAAAAAGRALAAVVRHPPARDVLLAADEGGRPALQATVAAFQGTVRAQEDPAAVSALGQLCLHWLAGSGAEGAGSARAVMAFLRVPGVVHSLVATARSEADSPAARLLSCSLLAAARLSLPAAERSEEIAELVAAAADALARGVGQDLYRACHEALRRERPAGQAAETWDAALDELVENLYQRAQSVTASDRISGSAGGEGDAALRALLREQEGERERLRQQVEALRAQQQQQVSPHSARSQPRDDAAAQQQLQEALTEVQRLRTQLAESERQRGEDAARSAAQQQTAEESLSCLVAKRGELEEENASLASTLDQLQQRLHQVEDELAAARAGQPPPAHAQGIPDAVEKEALTAEVQRLQKQLSLMEADQQDVFILLGMYEETLKQAGQGACRGAGGGQAALPAP